MTSNVAASCYSDKINRTVCLELLLSQRLEHASLLGLPILIFDFTCNNTNTIFFMTIKIILLRFLKAA